MSGEHLTRRDTVDHDPAATAVIEAYLDSLARQLPAHTPLSMEVLDELRDDLLEATAAHVLHAPSTVAAAHTAIAEFGDVATIAETFRPELATQQARRTGVALLVTGPMIGVCWLAAAFLTGPWLASAWQWLLLLALPLLALGAPATALAVASTGRLSRWLRSAPKLAGGAAVIAGITAGTGDLILLGGSFALLLMPVPVPSPLLALAAAGSLARLVFVGHVGVRLLGARRSPVPPSVTA